MPTFQVLVDQTGAVIGAARTDAASTGTGGPKTAAPVADTGQRLVQMSVDDKTAALDPTALLAALKASLPK